MTNPAAPLPSLTARQLAVALLVADGFTDKQIAARLEIAENTVGNYITAISAALSLDRSRNTRVQIAIRFARLAA